MRGAADTLKKISLELGGKSPNIFFADADFEAAVDGALFGVFINQGEVCSAGSRILVERPIYRKFVDAMVEKAQDDQARPAAWIATTKMGAARQPRAVRPRARSTRRSAKREAKLARGGGRATGGALDRGYFVEPTIFYDVDNSRAHRARGDFRTGRLRSSRSTTRTTRCGSPTTRTTASPRPCGRATSSARCAPSRTLRAGIVWVNHMQPTYVEAPWGGYKQSGIGRELGKWGVEEYLNVKQVFINLSEDPINWF